MPCESSSATCAAIESEVPVEKGLRCAPFPLAIDTAVLQSNTERDVGSTRSGSAGGILRAVDHRVPALAVGLLSTT
ncbi:MAG: hypothetical protein R2706_14935 [Acidimicrobiales bacterium]